MRFLIVIVVLMLGCEPKPVKCKETDQSFVHGMVCYCVTACETLKHADDGVAVIADGFCEPYCYVEK